MAVFLMDFKVERYGLIDWAEKQGEDGIKDYWEKKNTQSLDEHHTAIFKKDKP